MCVSVGKEKQIVSAKYLKSHFIVVAKGTGLLS